MRILGIFQSFDVVHPLWSTFNQWVDQYDVDWISLQELKESFSVKAFNPDIIFTDQFVLDVESLKAFPTVFYLLDYVFTDPKEEIINKLALAQEVYTCSVYLSKQIKQEYGIAAKVCLPYCSFMPASPQYILYDEGHPCIHEIHRSLPRENFRVYASIEDLNEAKLFLPIVQDDLFDNRICIAACKQIPVISEMNEYVNEFLQSYISVNSTQQWTQTIKSVLRDRSHWVNKLKTFASRYGNAENMDNQVRKVVKNKLSRQEITANTSCVEVQNKFDATRTTINNRRRRTTPKTNTPSSLPIASSIFLSGGIGDVIALEGYMSDEQREKLTTICYGTNKQSAIEQIFRALPNYTNLKNHQVVWNDFSSFWCFLYKSECKNKIPVDQQTPEFNVAEDWGILTKFSQVKTGLIKYTYSSLIRHTLCSINHIPLPVNYVVISPYSSDKRLRSRDFNDDDWAAAIYHLIKKNMTGVVLNNGSDYVPNNSCLIDLSNKTSFVEAVEILKKAKGYMGIDSSLSVMAAKLFEYPNFMVKSQNDHCHSNKHIYYAPQNKFNFLGMSIAKLIPKG